MLVSVKAVNDEHEIMMITTEGVIIRLRMEDINTLGRITSGVKLMNLEPGVKIAQAAKVRDRLSNGEKEFDNVEEAEESLPEVEDDFDDGKEVSLPHEDDEEDE